ncbi:MAG: hypothetical protein M9932_01805 [Xanthobacteraceae bacterium]|nr:hypothetical protein [Xanthobacteraceae bacterium]
MDLYHCTELMLNLADKLADAYPLGRPPGELFDETRKFSKTLARDYVRSVGGSQDDIESLADSMMRKFCHRYGWLTERTSTRILQRVEPRGTA